MVWRFLFPKKIKKRESDNIHDMVKKFQNKGLKVNIVETSSEKNPLREIFSSDEYLDLYDVSENCPDCKRSFGKIPTRSIKCKQCGNQFLVKKDPFQQDVKYLILKKQFHDKEVYWKPYIDYKKTKKWLDSTYPNGAKKFVNRDFDWHLLSNLKISHARRGDLGLCRNISYEQSKFLMKEGKMKNCYLSLCEVNYYDINGAQNSNLGFDPSDGFVAPVPLKQMFETARELNYNYDTAKEKFVKRVNNLGGPVRPKEAFEILAKEYDFS
jgi:DNA-directed RNA polymerase subunit RPC12/RpoP